MPFRDIYLKIETMPDYTPVAPDKEVSPPIVYLRDCMRNPGHEDGTITADEANARRLTALVYREYLDPGFLIPKPDKIVLADINEPAYDSRVPGAVVYARPGDWLRIHVKNEDSVPHSFHLHGLKHGIESDGAWPFGTQSADGRRSDEICPGQTWTYNFDVTDQMIGAWPFYDHYRDMGASVNRGLFGGLIVLPGEECDELPRFQLPNSLTQLIKHGIAPEESAGHSRGEGGHEGPASLEAQLHLLEEVARAPHIHPRVKPSHVLHVPLFFHLMSGERLPSLCFNGRTFVGNTPTILAAAGQRIRWYVFNLDLGTNWHNFHPHAQRWQFAKQNMDVRSLGPAESFVVETKAPPVLLLPPEIQKCQDPGKRPEDAKPFDVRGDFLFHCNSESDIRQGLAGLVRSTQTIWLTAEQAAQLQSQMGLPLDPGDNSCPAVDFDRCTNSTGGKWEELPGVSGVTFMHAVLLPNTRSVLFWGYGPRPDQSRVWDQTTGLYSPPANQPSDISPDENIWSCAHAHLNDAAGTILVHGGLANGPDTERRAFLFDPPTLTWSHATETNVGRFYPTTITLGDGRALTLFGQDTVSGIIDASFEVFTPGGAGSWSPLEALPFDYFYYPWTFLLPDGELFVAGPQKPARRFDWTVTPVVDDPAKQFNQVFSQRGANMDGTAVLLPLRPPGYEPRVLIAGGATPDTQQSAEWIDLAAGAPAWQALPNMNVPRDKMNSVLMPDGTVLMVGGVEGGPDPGPVETFDPEDPLAGFEVGPTMQHVRGYHSAAILLADGSVLVGGDPGGDFTPHERYLPPYFFKARPAITGAPAAIAYGADFTINTPDAGGVAEVVLMRPGAVTHGFNMGQRYVGCAIVSAGGGAVQATAPPNDNTAPSGYYLLFVVNGDRVPSEGVWVKLG